MFRVTLVFFALVGCCCGLLMLAWAQQPQTGPTAEKRFPPLNAPPGFKATLFACDPLIEYPSVISIGPKPGAIFVAIDYMTGLGTDGKVKSEVRLVEDTDGDGYADKAAVVAKGFNSIQGLAYHEDTLFVMHAPFLTAVRGGERQDLLSGLGLTPEQNAVRLHCANGVTIGHDGWLYLSMGDNGVNVPRPEGDRLVHNGGAILRCRLDGRDLHVYATGLRNIYDVALDAELNVFTRDNENDGGTYMIRVCHSFFGADHGYPYDYYERPDHAMKPIGDFGLGSSAGGVCYLETQFPPEYRGNLFFCEWGKSVVRYPLTPANSSFAPVKEIEFLTGDAKDPYPFKPTDVIVQRDGTLMVADYADGQRPKRGRGRIYHIAYAGRDADPVKPVPTPKTDADWLNQLDSAGYYDRWEAQRHVENKHSDESKKLYAAALKAPLGKHGRLHRIWMIAKLERADAVGRLLEIARSDNDIDVRVQAVRALGDIADPVLIEHKLDVGRGDAKLAEALASLPNATNARLLREVTIVLGRLRWAGSPDWLRAKLVGPDAAWMHAALHTLRRADNWPAVFKLLDQSSESAVRRVALRALADRFNLDVVDELIRQLETSSDPARRREYADLLTRVYKKPGPWKYWGYRPGPRPANTEVWERTQAIEKALDRCLANRNQTERAVILARMQREKIPVRLATLAGWLKEDYAAESELVILTAMKEYPAAQVRSQLDEFVRDKARALPNRKLALEMLLAEKSADAPTILVNYAKSLEEGLVLADVLRRLALHPNAGALPALASRLKSTDARVRAAAIEALGELRAPEGRDAILPSLKDPHPGLRRAAAGAAGKLGAKEAIETLLQLAGSADHETRGLCLDSLRMLGEPRALKFAIAALQERPLEMQALACLAELGGPADAKVVVAFAKQNFSTDVLGAVIRALTAWRQRPGVSELQRQELDRAVAEIQGASGILVQWDTKGAIPIGERDGIVKAMSIPGKRSKSWNTMLATGAEGRLTLRPGDAPWYALTDVEVPSAASVEFLASSQGTLEVWLNGASIHRRASPGKFQLDSDRFAGTLEKGANRVLVATASEKTVEFHLRFRRKSSKAEHEALTQAALTRPGNAGRGSKIFFDKEKAQCIKCHQLGNQGERIGPELTGVGNRFSRIHLIESILEPSRTIAPSFGTFIVTLKSGKTLNGVKIAETQTSVTFADNQGQKHTLASKDIDELNPSPISVMPEGLEARLTVDEFVDLIAFLTSQKEARPRE